MSKIEVDIQPEFQALAKSHVSLLYANLSTEDGFALAHVTGAKSKVEADKVSALASTLFSLAESSAEDANADTLRVLVMEAEKSASVAVRSSVRKTPVILTMAMDDATSVGRLLYLANQKAKALAAL